MFFKWRRSSTNPLRHVTFRVATYQVQPVGPPMEQDDRCFLYRGHLLMCDPTRLGGGGYQANAVIVRADLTGDTVIAATLEKLVFISEGAAVVHAKERAAHWVDERAGPESAMGSDQHLDGA
jgi:hypothetical protein